MTEVSIEEFTDEIKEELNEKGANKVWQLDGNMRLYECPLTYITQDTWDTIRLIYMIDGSQHLLYAGGWSDQPYWLIEAYEIFKSEQAEQIKRGKEKS